MRETLLRIISIASRCAQVRPVGPFATGGGLEALADRCLMAERAVLAATSVEDFRQRMVIAHLCLVAGSTLCT
jgi:hypothetical protein